MTQPSLVIERDKGIVQLRFNRPNVLNALDIDLAQNLLSACQEMATDPGVKVVILSGSGRAFMAGGDLNQLRENPVDNAKQIIGPMHDAIRLLTQLSAPVIVSVHGAAAGAGFSLLLAADLVIAAEGTRFSFSYTDIGTCCDGGASWSLPRLVGLRKAMEIALLSKSFTTDEAMQLGLLTRVVPLASLVDATRDMAERLVLFEAPALGHLKRLLRSASEHSLEEQLDAEQAAFIDCVGRPEFIRSIDTFYAQSN